MICHNNEGSIFALSRQVKCSITFSKHSLFKHLPITTSRSYHILLVFSHVAKKQGQITTAHCEGDELYQANEEFRKTPNSPISELQLTNLRLRAWERHPHK